MSTPLVPPRPTRSSAAGTGPTAVPQPQVPPRPVRKMDPSPSRDLRSPFNEPPNPMGNGSKRLSASNLAKELPPRPPSVQALPLVGQEGSEYASFDQLPAEAHGVGKAAEAGTETVEAPEQTKNISASMPLHAPRASLPQSTAKSRIQTVTRTDSTQAAAAGIGKAAPDDDVHKGPGDTTASLSRVTSRQETVGRPPSTDLDRLRSKTSFNRSTPSLHHQNSRPGSIHEGNFEQGIPEIGMQIPLNRMAGDAQAPSPAPSQQSQFTPGIGFYNDGSSRAHHRRRSSRQHFAPPDSFGLHGHGQEPHDQFERDWIKKHPEQAAVEGFNYHGPPKPETALSSAELNKLVSGNSDIGMGTSADVIGTPGPEVAWEATTEYASRYSTPQASPAPPRTQRSSGDTERPQSSSLRKASFPFNAGGQDTAVAEDDGVIHVDPPVRGWNKVTGGGEPDGTVDLGPGGGNTEEEGGWYIERGEGTPILASDELAKRPSSAFLQPAVSPADPHVDDYHYESDTSHNETSRRNSLRIPSRPSSRPNSMHGEFHNYHGGNLHRFISHDEYHGSGHHTPLEEIEEYEPLIPEDEDTAPKPKPKELKKRPGLEHHHFPSQDIWEDTPLSLQYSTTVETPEPPREAEAAPEAPSTTGTSTFETPEEEEARVKKNPNDMWSDSKTLVNKPHARALDEYRPGVQRFPSHDIWEDTPDSMRLVTTVSGPQMDETQSPPDDRPTTYGNEEDENARASTGFTQVPRPSIPARPTRKSKLAEEIKPEDESAQQDQVERDIPLEKQISLDKAKPAIPERPKPSVPARPTRPSRGEQDQSRDLAAAAGVPATAEASKSPPMPKAKPTVPARPGGEKIAALKAGFMNDLNNRLKLGPQAPPKPKEPEPEAAVEEATKEPLADARKSRAKGPARRKPASSPSAAAPSAFSFSTMTTLWHIDESDELQIPALTVSPPEETEAAKDDVPAALNKEMSLNEQQNTEEPTLAEPPVSEEPEAKDEASLDEKIGAAQQEVEKLAGAEHDAAAAKEPSAESTDAAPVAAVEQVAEGVAPTAADVEAKETAPATSDAQQPSVEEKVADAMETEQEGVAKE